MKQNKMIPTERTRPYLGQQVPFRDDDDLIDLRLVFSRVWHGKWIIFICVLFAGAFGYLTASQYLPTYGATAKVMFAAPENEIIDLGGRTPTPTARNGLQDQIEVLRSSNLAGKVVDDLGLERNPEFNPTLRTVEPRLIDRARGLVAVPEWAREALRDFGLMSPPPPPRPEPDPEELAQLERRIVVQNVLSSLSVRPVPDSRVIEIGVASQNPRTAASVANSFAEQYITDQLDARLEATRAATDWLSGRVEELQMRLQVAEEAVENARASLSFEAGQSLEITQQQLQALNATLSVVRNETRIAEAVYGRLRAALDNEAEYGAIPEFRTSPVISEFRTRQAELLSQRASLLQSVDEQHPSVTRVDRVLDEASRNMRNEAQQIVEAARLEWESQRQEEADIEADVRALETLALDQSRDQVTVRQLEREAEASRILYENFLARLQETAEQQRFEEPDSRILTRAEAPFSPLMQRQNRTLMVSLIAGALAGLGIIFLLDRLNNTFRSAPQLEQMTGETVLGMLPIIGRGLRRKAVLQRFRDKPKSSLAEAVRSLRTSILFSNVDKPPKVVMFTSSVPREGKSTTAMLVAMTSRQMGRSAVIVDCDLRLPALADLVGGINEGPGLLSAINGNATLDEAIHKDNDSGLHVLMTKPSEPRSNVNAADILSSARFDELIEELKEAYDLVILDTPPTLAVADPRILASHADVVVYVVRWDDTPRDAVQEGLNELRKLNAPVGGIVLSMVNEAKAARYTYAGYNSYRGRHRNYYVE